VRSERERAAQFLDELRQTLDQLQALRARADTLKQPSPV
jgi:hypothetical protein